MPEDYLRVAMTVWKIKAFDGLSLKELYELLALRQEVFVIEQDCPYLDADGKDFDSHHVMGYKNSQLAAYARVVKPGISYGEISIGRIVTSPTHRKTGLGKALMKECHEFINTHFGREPIRISAQCYLERFYTELGYAATGKEYLEDGIPHMEMLRTSE